MVRALSILDIEPPCFLYGKDISTMEPLYPFIAEIVKQPRLFIFLRKLENRKKPRYFRKIRSAGAFPYLLLEKIKTDSL
jgi:hypothetical protein